MDNLLELFEAMNYRYENPDQTNSLNVDSKIAHIAANNVNDLSILEQIELWASMSNEPCAYLLAPSIEKLKDTEIKGMIR